MKTAKIFEDCLLFIFLAEERSKSIPKKLPRNSQEIGCAFAVFLSPIICRSKTEEGR
jgi:hypothetical protein